jgi:DNA polymerase-3 subunit epsilon
MNYLFFDTETTGLPKNWKAPVTDLSNWPRLVQLGFIRYNSSGIEQSRGEYIVTPNGFTIPTAASDVHRVTTERALQEGVELDFVLDELLSEIRVADCLVAHNMSFDEKIIGAEFLRRGDTNHLNGKSKICTMHSTTDFCALEGYYGHKWPKLEELYFKLFGCNFDNAHSAIADIEATAKCFWELKSRSIL